MPAPGLVSGVGDEGIPGNVSLANRNSARSLWKRPGTGERADLPGRPDHDHQPGVGHGLEGNMAYVDVLQGIDGFGLESGIFDRRTEASGQVGRRRLRREERKWHSRDCCGSTEARNGELVRVVAKVNWKWLESHLAGVRWRREWWKNPFYHAHSGASKGEAEMLVCEGV